MAKELYSRLFDYIIDLVNKKLAGEETPYFISVLDIYGFEQFEYNRYGERERGSRED
jgi:myosin heavy subunit